MGVFGGSATGVVIGHIGEIKYHTGEPITRANGETYTPESAYFSIATNREVFNKEAQSYDQVTDWTKVKVYNTSTVKSLKKLAKTGTLISVSGALEPETYENNGKRIESFAIVVRSNSNASLQILGNYVKSETEETELEHDEHGIYPDSVNIQKK